MINTMTKRPYQLALHIFRRDLRLQDNTALIEALRASQQVIVCFIFDKRQIAHNPYKSEHCIQFMLQSLSELEQALQAKSAKLYYFYGIAEEIVAELITQQKIDAVFINRDYTPFSRKRDQQLAKVCAQHQIGFHCYADALLHEPEHIKKDDGKPYTIFTAFFRKAKQLTVNTPRKNLASNYFNGKLSNENTTIFHELARQQNSLLAVKGGRKEAQGLLHKIARLKNYAEIRNFPAIAGTTHLSAHHKFGTVSIREVYQTIINEFGSTHTLINELYWRDFFTHIAYHYPHVFGNAFHKQYQTLNWEDNDEKFAAWCEGRTGFPIVDAGMRELNTTGFMHNRVRMITASFLTKDLHIDWRLGEKYFANKLVDYDPAVNNGNWQWAASTGCDAQPYFRIFNPWLQQKKFDADCIYIRKYVPELEMLSEQQIHTRYDTHQLAMTHYPMPMIDHRIESERAKLRYKNVVK